MHRRTTAVAVVAALVAATGGTALAAGELVTRSDQIAPGVVDGRHVKAHGLARTDQEHASLRLRVRLDGKLFGDPRDGTATRSEIGVYRVTFDRTAIADDVAAPRDPRWLDDCAVVATPRTGGIADGDVILATTRSTSPGTVVVQARRLDFELGRTVGIDAPFDVAAVC